MAVRRSALQGAAFEFARAPNWNRTDSSPIWP